VGATDWSDRLVGREWQFGMFCRDIIEWGKEVLSVEFIGDCSGYDNGWGSLLSGTRLLTSIFV
jgi:hypothetical protein